MSRTLHKQKLRQRAATETIKAPKNWNKLKIAEKYNKVLSKRLGGLSGWMDGWLGGSDSQGLG